MSDRKLAVLGIIAVLAIIWAVVQSRISNRPRARTDTSVTYLIQGLDPAGIDKVVIGGGDNVVTLKRKDKFFLITEKDDFPAEMGEINKLITSCLDVKVSEMITGDAANHKELGVTEDNAEAVVKFFKADGTVLTGVIVGKTRGEQGGGTYVRLIGSDKVYVTDEAPWIRTGPLDYTKREILSLDRKNIESVTVKTGNEKYTLKARPEGQDVLLEDVPEGKKPKYNDCTRVFTALTNVTFDDVQSEAAADKDLAFNTEYVCRLKDSTVYTLKAAKKDFKYYITCDAEFTDQTPVTKPDPNEPEEELKKKEAKLLAQDNARLFNTRHKDWVYQIPDYKAENLVARLSDLVEDKEPKPQQPEAAKDPNSAQ